MDQEKTKRHKAELEKERAALLKDLVKENKPSDFGGDIDHYDEEADEAEEFSNQLALGQSDKERINEIDRALEKIKAGGYGVCEECGKEIEDKVLDVSPESRFCRDCKSEKNQ